ALEVLYIGAGDQPLVRALQAIDGVSVFRADGLPDDLRRFGLVVVDNVAVPRAPETSTLWIGAARVEGAAEPASLPAGGPTNWRNDHALARDIGWAGVEVDAAAAVAIAPPASATTLLEAGGGPLIAARTGAHGREVWLAFDPVRAGWSQQASF